MPKVTVIIPNYNHAPFLEKRIKSVLNQTYQDFEVIFLDDASPDNSRQVFSQFENDPRIRAIFNETNSGCVFKQWNKGFKEAKGEYIWIAESDDFADESLLETLVNCLDQHPSAGVAYCQSWVVDENDRQVTLIEANRPEMDSQRWLHDFFTNGRDEVRQYMIRGSIILNASAVVMRREVVEKVGGADDSFRVSGDWLFWVKMLLASDLAFVAKPLNFWRNHSGTVRRSTLRNGVMVSENYRVLTHIIQSVDVDEATLEIAREMRFNSWVCYSEDGRFGFALNRSIYRLARAVDPYVNKRIMAYLPLAPIRLLGRPILHKIKARKAKQR